MKARIHQDILLFLSLHYSLDFTFLINTDQFTALEFIMYNLFILTLYLIFQ